MAQSRTGVRRFLRRLVGRERDCPGVNDNPRSENPADLAPGSASYRREDVPRLIPGTAPGTTIVKGCGEHDGARGSFWYMGEDKKLEYNAQHLSSIYSGTFLDDFFDVNCSQCRALVPRNPLLCDACQKWNLAEYVLGSQDDISGETRTTVLSMAPADCLVCRVVFELVHSNLANTMNDSVACATSFINRGFWSFGDDWEVCHLRNMRQNAGKTQGMVNIAAFTDGREEANGSACSDDLDYRNPSAEAVGIDQRIELTYERSGVGLQNIRSVDNVLIDVRVLRNSIASQKELAVDDTIVIPIHGIRLIDCRNKCIIEPSWDNDMRFVALSWVWASSTGQTCVDLSKDNLEEMMQLGGVKEEGCPYVVWDAIQLCEDLGQQHLWSDRLCILHDDKDEVERQVGQMDQIYSQAVFTIVSIADYRLDRGLPGVRGRPRRLPKMRLEGVKVDRLRHRITLDPRGLIDRSEWSTRGWTLQERLLSNRCLYISNYTWLFTSTSNVYHENAGLLRTSEAGLRGQDHTGLGSEGKLISIAGDYARLVEDYTKRRLTYETDILDAFAGIAHLVSRQLDTLYISGLFERFFHEGLLWSYDGSFGQRKTVQRIPSWSWAAWNGGADYRGFSNHIDDFKIGPLVNLHYSAPVQGVVQLQPATGWFDDLYDPDELKKADTLTWASCPHNQRTMTAHKTLDSVALDLARRIPGSLVFNTTVSSLALSRGFDAGNPPEMLHQGDISIIGPGGGRIGAIMRCTSAWAETWLDVTKMYEFIVLSAGLADGSTRQDCHYGGDLYEKDKLAQLFGRAKSQYDFDHFWTLNVMLIERDKDQPLLCRRVAIGFVVMRHWAACNPKWETIVLI